MLGVGRWHNREASRFASAPLCPAAYRSVRRRAGGYFSSRTPLRRPLRSTWARNLSRAGVPEAVAMEMIGHKTRSMYRRYRIVDERDLREATTRLQEHLERQPKVASVGRLRANG